MAIEFLISQEIKFGKIIEIPKNANYFIRKSKTISPKKARQPRINFFRVNPSPSYRMMPIPKNAGYISFDMEINKYNIEYGRPIYYDCNGKILK